MTELQVVDLGNFPVDEATPVVAGPRGQAGADGASAYEVAVANGFVGTEAEWLASLGGGPGGGAVDSVNGQVGAVVLDAADVGADPTGTAAAASTADRARANHTGTQSSATISDFTEAVQDAVAALLTSGTNVTLTYDDTANTLTVASASGGDVETIRDTIGAALVGVGNVAVTVNDAADTITVSTTATVNSTDAALRDRSTHTGTQAASTITGLGTAATKNVPASGNASSTEVVMGNDTRLSGGGTSNVLLLAAGASVPGGTAAGTLIYEKAATTTKFPVARYTLDETSGNFLDGTGNGRTAVATAGTVYSRPPISPGSTFAAASNGTNSAIAAWAGTTISGMDTTASLECYVRIPAGTVSYKGGFICTTKWGLGIGGSGTNALGSNLLICQFGIGWVNAGFTFLAGNTYHLVATRAAGNAVKVYVDGAQVYSNTVSIGAGDGGNLQVGSDSGVGPLSTGIDIDDATFYNVTLTATQAGQPLVPVNSGKAKGWWDGTALQPLA